MKKYIYILALAALLPACEKKETTVNNPAGTDTKTETNTTTVEKPASSPASTP